MEPSVYLNIHGRAPFAEGQSFGNTGPYERIWGEVRFAVDPAAEAYRDIVDIDLAPRNRDDLVEYSTDFYVLKPAELKRGNGRLLYEVNNRGMKLLLQFLNDAHQVENPETLEHAGNGFLMRRGYTLLWSGWQGDILPGAGRLCLRVPVATQDGAPITGRVRTEFAPADPITGYSVGTITGYSSATGSARCEPIVCIPLGGNTFTDCYEAASLDPSSASLTFRERESDARIAIPPSEWRFAFLDERSREIPSPKHCLLPAGFRPGWIYELIYTAKNPLVLGLGFAGVRDLVAFAMHAERDANGSASPFFENGRHLDKAYGWGCSQSSRFLREFVYRGYNADTQERQVFQGITAFVSGGGRVWLNSRFAQPGRYPRDHFDRLYPSDQFPFAYPVLTDPLSGQTDGILKRPETDPLIVHAQSSSEYWNRRGSLVHSDSHGHSIADHPRARVYLLSSAEHSADPLLGPQVGFGRYPTNPLNVTALLRALQDTLDQWATHGTQPPESRVPRIEEGTGVLAPEVGRSFPALPGVHPPDSPNRLFVQDFGPRFHQGLIDIEPPREDRQREYRVLVPSVDADGNEVAGIRGPDLAVPVATYTGWNFRVAGEPANAMAEVYGSYFPFAWTRAGREAGGDPRPSLEERYGSHERYVARIAGAARALLDERLLLAEDVERFITRAKQRLD